MKRLDFLLKNIKPGKILDVGNLDKQGKIHKILIEKLPKSEIFGIDVSDQEKLGLSFANQAIGSMEEMEFPDNFFDSVYMGQVLEHSWMPKNLLDKVFPKSKLGKYKDWTLKDFQDYYNENLVGISRFGVFKENNSFYHAVRNSGFINKIFPKDKRGENGRDSDGFC